MRTVAVCVARMGSTRLPGKVMMPLAHIPLLRWTIEAARCCNLIDKVVLATTTLPEDDVIAKYCETINIPCYRGDSEDVLSRFYGAAKEHEADIVLRFTCDCPFLDPGVIGEVIKLREKTNADFASNCYPPTYPDGLDTECFTFAALEIMQHEATNAIDRNSLTQFVVRNRSLFKAVNVTCPIPGLDNEHWVCDTADDFHFCQEVAARVNFFPVDYISILDALDKEPLIRKINDKSIRNERFYDALSVEPLSPRTFERSQRVFERASKVIPLASQTVSKSYLQYPLGASPLAISHGDGAYLFDVDGNRYVDLVGGLGPVILGYSDPDINEAIRRQLDDGISFSLASEKEAELAEMLCEIIPCAERVKFGKSGTDVTTAAVKLARAYTGREHIGVGGYHGWADWSMVNTNRNLGIPEILSEFCHSIGKKEKGDVPIHPRNLAAIIVEPNDDPQDLKKLREFCDEWGIILIFDEILTGFRCELGGVQQMYGVTPDLACFGKAMANGMPISALVGKREIMQKFEDPKLHYSGTFFGEALSIAAAIATIKKIQSHNVIGHIVKTGISLEYNLLKEIKACHLEDYISISGHYSNLKLAFKGEHKDRIRALFMMGMMQEGVLIINANTLSYAHKTPEFVRIVTAYANVFAVIKKAIESGDINDIKPLAAPPLRAA